jgi:hypothetical protein
MDADMFNFQNDPTAAGGRATLTQDGVSLGTAAVSTPWLTSTLQASKDLRSGDAKLLLTGLTTLDGNCAKVGYKINDQSASELQNALSGSATSSVPPASPTSNAPSSSGVPSVLPVPAGYALSTTSGTVNGPITPQYFDKTVGAGAASSTHFLHGYDVTYDSNFTSESIESTLFTFASSADASGFASQVLGNVGAATLSPTRSSLSSIPGSVVLTGTKSGSDGYYIIDVVAQKGATIMAVEYSNNSALTGVPDVLSTSASEQYALL